MRIRSNVNKIIKDTLRGLILIILKFIAIYYFLVGEFSSRATLIIILMIIYHYHMYIDMPFWLLEMILIMK